MTMPALAVVGSDHQVVRSTETFRRKCDDTVALCDGAPELDLVLTGQTDTAVVELGDFSVAIEAVTDAAGMRQAMLSVTQDEPAADPDLPFGALREAADDSPAIVWAKDLDGRYLYVNARFEQFLEVSAENVNGSTDADLAPAETVDGPRLRAIVEDELEEPLQLEYTVPEFESRPAMAAFRFPVHDDTGQPIATCGVAAPSKESNVAQDEAVRLMELERWSRLDPVQARAELLEQWHVRATPGQSRRAKLNGLLHKPLRELVDRGGSPAQPPIPPGAEETNTSDAAEPDPAEPSAEVEAAEQGLEPAAPGGEDLGYRREEEWVRQLRQSAQITTSEAVSETADALHTDLQLARTWAERAEQLQGELQQANTRLRAAEAEAQQASASAQLATEAANRHEAELGQAREELGQAREELAQARAQAREELARGREELSQVREELDREQAALAQAREELERQKAEAQAARSELEAADRDAEVLAQAREELEREKAEAHSARSELEAARRDAETARRELGAARAQCESLRGPADAASRLSDELGKALTAERERGDELARTLARVRSRLGDLDTALGRKPQTGPKS